MNKQTETLLVNQVEREFYSAYLYLAISNFYEEKGLIGFGSWFRKQAEEEKGHALKFLDYLHKEGRAVPLKDIKAPSAEFKELREPLALQLSHEKVVTGLIDGIYASALADADTRTQSFLRQFIDEQAEEEETAAVLLGKFDMLSESKVGLYLLDKELGKRE